MRRFFSFITRQSVAIILIVVFVLILGIWACFAMPINLLPDINIPMVCTQVIYAGANAQAVEDAVTIPLEEGLSSISGVTDVSSYSYDNVSAVILSFDYGTDTSEKKTDIQDKLSGISLPDGVYTTIYDIDLNSEALATLSVTSNLGDDEQENLEYAYEAAKTLGNKLAAVDGVESVDIKGGADYYYLIQPFGGLELVAPLIVEAFSYGSAYDLPLGDVTYSDGESVQVRNSSDIATEEDILNMPVTLPESVVKILASARGEIDSYLEEYYPLMTAEDVASSDFLLGIVQSTIAKMYDAEYSTELIKLILTTDFDKIEGDWTVRVSEIATVKKDVTYSSYVYYSDGEASLIKGTVIEIYKSNGANSSAVVDDVKEIYADFEAGDGLAYGASVRLLDDQSEFISTSINNVVISMIIGGVLAIIVIFLFLKKVRTSLIIAVTMPLSILAAIICLYLMGITMNMVSLGGLAVGIGMLVDNSIVVIENITMHREKGKNPYRAAVDGTAEVAGALFGSTITTICVFIPIMFIGGLTAEIFTDLAWAVIFSLAFSLIVAVTVIPALYVLFTKQGPQLLRGGKPAAQLALSEDFASFESEEVFDGEPHPEPDGGAVQIAEGETVSCPAAGATALADGAGAGGVGGDEGGDDLFEKPEEPESEEKEGEKKKKKSAWERFKEPRIMNGITSFYGKVLPAVLNKKLITIIIAVVIFAASVGLLFVTGMEFLPSVDKGQIEVTMDYGSSADLDVIQEDVFKFSQVIEDNVDNIDYLSVSVGMNGLLALTNTGVITVQLATSKHTSNVCGQIRDLAVQQGDDILGTVTVKEIDGVVASLTSGTDDLAVTIVGEDSETLKEIAEKICAELAENDFYDIKDSSTEKSLEANIVFDRYEMARLGLDYETVVLTLRVGLASYTACSVTIDGTSYDVNVQFADGAVETLDDLEKFVIGYGSSGDAIRLEEVLAEEIEVVETEACIRRSNGNGMISVSASKNTDSGSATSEMEKIASEVLKDYPGYSFESSGVGSYLSDAFSGLAVALVISLFLLYAVMAIQFGSAIKPLIIMVAIPFSFTGGFLALVITGSTLNVVSFIGLIMLMGVIVNNAIVMLEKIKQLRSEGMRHYEAVQEACKNRLRPILMTTLTTILALIPMAISIGSGGELMQPLGIVVIGGLLIGTLVTLVIVPVVYCAVNGLSKDTPSGRADKKKKVEPADGCDDEGECVSSEQENLALEGGDAREVKEEK